jgi:beta-N-acetylhexosaminidase
MKALKFTTAINTEKAFKAGCNLVLHCNARMSEMTIVAKNSPKVDSFLLKKTLEFYKLVAI